MNKDISSKWLGGDLSLRKYQKINHENKSKRCDCEKQIDEIRRQLDRIENTIESISEQPPTGNRCDCRASFGGLKRQPNDFAMIEGIICDNCRFGIELGYTTQSLDFQSVLLESATCLVNSTMRVIGIGRLSGRLVDFELFLTRNPNTIRLIVFKCQETFIDTTFTGAEVAPSFSITRCPR